MNGHTITQPCGHTADFEEVCLAPDHFNCPICGLRWKVTTGPVQVYPSGFVAPGDRKVVIEAQSNLPLRLPHFSRQGGAHI